MKKRQETDADDDGERLWWLKGEMARTFIDVLFILLVGRSYRRRLLESLRLGPSLESVSKTGATMGLCPASSQNTVVTGLSNSTWKPVMAPVKTIFELLERLNSYIASLEMDKRRSDELGKIPKKVMKGITT